MILLLLIGSQVQVGGQIGNARVEIAIDKFCSRVAIGTVVSVGATALGLEDVSKEVSTGSCKGGRGQVGTMNKVIKNKKNSLELPLVA